MLCTSGNTTCGLRVCDNSVICGGALVTHGSRSCLVCGTGSLSSTYCGAVRIPEKKRCGIRLISRDGIAVGSISGVHIPIKVPSSMYHERIALCGNRTFFRITGSRDGPFVMGAPGYGVRMLKAGFSIRMIRSGACIALIRNDITMQGNSRERVLLPNRQVIVSRKVVNEYSISISRCIK